MAEEQMKRAKYDFFLPEMDWLFIFLTYNTGMEEEAMP